MKYLIGGLCMAVMLLAAPGVALADARGDEVARLALANKFIMLMQGDELTAAMTQMMDMVIPPVSDVTDEEAAEIRAVAVEMTQSMMPRMFEAMAPVYADIFTLEELRGLVAFYESDLGQSLLRKSYQAMPRLNEAAMSVMPEILTGMGDTMCDRLECSADERREMKNAMAEAARGMATPSGQ